jgi:hypothetical protein
MRAILPVLLLFGAFLLSAGARAEAPVVISAAPDKVAVTIYRDPSRSSDSKMDLENLGSFALIAETRTVDLPPGVVTIRFEGVAGGIIPQSAILFGGDIREKNRDAALLSQKGLLDGFTGQRVTLKRTDPATGKMVEEPATLRSAQGGIVVTTPRGIEAVYCSGLNQTLLYPDVPRTLSPKPVLTMTTRDQPGGRVSITLAYLSQKFDWDATYIGTLSDDGQELGLFAWLTMGSGDETSFIDAQTAAVAGKVNRDEDTVDYTGEDARYEAERFYPRFGCWPMGTTSDGLSMPPPPVLAAPPPIMAEFDGDSIVVTAQRSMELMAAVPIAVTAVGESLGDLKLYRIPVPVTVAAQSQKQVAFLQKAKIKGKMIHRTRVYYDAEGVEMLYRFKNDEKSGAGDPLPAGQVALFQNSDNGRMLIGETRINDKAKDEEVDLIFGEASNVSVESEDAGRNGKNWEDRTITVSNANPFAITFEAEFEREEDYKLTRFDGKMTKRRGRQVWSVTIPANSAEKLRYRRTEIELAE